jgi:hypothetical protein
MTVWADYKLYVDWDNDLLFANAYSDITADWQGDLTFTRGRDRNSQLVGRSVAGTINVQLNNFARKYSKFNSASPIYGDIKPGRAIKLTMKIGTGSEVTICYGVLRNITTEGGAQRQDYTANLTGIGILGVFKKTNKVNIPMQTAIKSGTAADIVLDQIGWADSARLIDDGQSTLVRFWTGGEIDALQALRDIEDTEAGFIRESKDGKLIFEDRAHRFASPHTVSQATYTHTPGSAITYKEIHPVDTMDDIYNVVTARIRTFNLSEEKQIISLVDLYDLTGNTGDPIAIGVGETISIELKFPTKNSGTNEISVSSWETITYEANSAIDAEGTDVTVDIVPVDGAGVQISAENENLDYGKFDNKRYLNFRNDSGATAYLVVLKADAILVIEGDGYEVSSRDDTSIGDYNLESTYPFPGKYITSPEEGQAFCDYFVALYKDPRMAVDVVIEGCMATAHLTEIQTRDISDRVTIINDEGMSGDYFIENERHRIVKNGVHDVTYLCSQVAGTSWAASNVTYTPKEVPDVSTDVPDQLIWTNALPMTSSVLFLCGAEKWNANIDKAEFRAKRITPGTTVLSVDLRTPSENGTFAHNGTDSFIVEDIFADWRGFRYEHFYGNYSGIWYWAIRLHNDKGWSNWTDGNKDPQYVVDNINTEATALFDIGPPADWDITLNAGVQSGTAVVMVTRPRTNGNRIMSIAFQIRDATSGAWRNIDADTGAADTLYDGSEINHTYNPITGVLRKDSGTYGDAATYGGLMLIDVRSDAFDHRCCIWREVSPDQFDGANITGIQAFAAAFSINANSEYNKLRIRIVRAPWTWNAAAPVANLDGFLAGAGFSSRGFVSAEQIGDIDSDNFISMPFTIPTGKTLGDLGARVWFENTYSISDDENTTISTVDAVTQSVQIPIILHATAAGSPPAAGEIAMVRIPCNMHLEGVTILADVSGDISFDIKMGSFADYPTNTTIVSGTLGMTGAQKYQDFTLTGWTRNLIKDDCLVLSVKAGAATITKATLTLYCTKTQAVGIGSTPGGVELPEPWAYWSMDEISTFDIVGGPSIWWEGLGPSGRGRYIWIKHTYQIAGDVESLANGDAYGPIYIPPLKAINGFWKSASRTIGVGAWAGGGAGTHFYDDSYALQNVRLIGYKIWTNSVDGGPVGIKGWQAIYRDSAGATVYGTIRGTTSGETENQFIMDDDEYITGIKGYHGWNDQSAFKQKIIQLEFVTNLGSYKYGSAYDTAFTINVPTGPTGQAYTFAGLHGSYAGDPRAMRVVGILYYIDTYNSADVIPDDVTAWNLYTSEDGETYTKSNAVALGLSAIFQET